MDDKKDLENVWKQHAQDSNYISPRKEDLLKSKDFIYRWLNEIKNKNKMKLLDAGCGIGQYVTGTRILGFKSEGIDISLEAAEIGRKRGEKITVGDMRHLPFKDREFDVVLAGGSVEHFPETEIALLEINRVIKEKGLFLLNVPYRYTIYILVKKVQQALGLWKLGYEKSFSVREFKKKLEKSGFEVLEIKKSEIGGGRRFPLLAKIINVIDYVCQKIGFGGHHIWVKCIKK